MLKILQSRGSGVKRGTKSQFPESTKTIKGHDLYLGSLLFLTKTAPSPRFRTNLFLNYDLETGRLIIPDNIDKTIKKLDAMLQGKIVNTKINLLDETAHINIDDLEGLDDDENDGDGNNNSEIIDIEESSDE